MSKSEPEHVEEPDGVDNGGYENENADAPKKKRRRRPRGTETAESVAGTEPNVASPEQTDEARQERRRRRRAAKQEGTAAAVNGVVPTNRGIEVYLEDLQEDIESRADYVPDFGTGTAKKGKQVSATSGDDTVYVEGNRKFRPQTHDRFINKLKETQMVSDKLQFDQTFQDNELVVTSLGTAQRFRILSTFLLGIFSGLLLMHSLFVLIVGGTDTVTQGNFLTLYIPIQQGLAIFFYIAFLIVNVSLWDRLDIGHSQSSCNPQQAGMFVAVVLTLIAFIISNVMYLYDYNFASFRRNSSSVVLQNLVVGFQTWRILDIVRSVLVVISWFVVAMMPKYDRFVELLRGILNYDYDAIHNHTNVKQ